MIAYNLDYPKVNIWRLHLILLNDKSNTVKEFLNSYYLIVFIYLFINLFIY